MYQPTEGFNHDFLMEAFESESVEQIPPTFEARQVSESIVVWCAGKGEAYQSRKMRQCADEDISNQCGQYLAAFMSTQYPCPRSMPS